MEAHHVEAAAYRSLTSSTPKIQVFAIRAFSESQRISMIDTSFVLVFTIYPGRRAENTGGAEDFCDVSFVSLFTAHGGSNL